MPETPDLLRGKPSFKLLSALKSKISFIYFEYGMLVRESNSLIFKQGQFDYDIPAASLAFILLGPGTSITQPAMAELSRWGCSVSFVNGGGLGLHSSYTSTSSTTAKFAIKQAHIVSNLEQRLFYARKMYAFRWGEENVPKTYSLNKLMMLEGRRMKKLYETEASKYGILDFSRRSKPEFNSNYENINSLLTASNHLLYGLVNSVLLSIGFSPRLGIIHHGHANSFTFDIADLYKETITVPLAFELASNNQPISELRQLFRSRCFDYNFIPTIINDISNILNINPESEQEELTEVSYLWGGSDLIINNEGYSVS